MKRSIVFSNWLNFTSNGYDLVIDNHNLIAYNKFEFIIYSNIDNIGMELKIRVYNKFTNITKTAIRVITGSKYLDEIEFVIDNVRIFVIPLNIKMPQRLIDNRSIFSYVNPNFK